MAKPVQPAPGVTGESSGDNQSHSPAPADTSPWQKFLENKWRRRALLLAGFLILLLHLLEFPHHVYDATHDLSSHATFEYYAAKDFQFGTEVYQNVGPYGFVHYAYSYIGYLHWEKVLLKTFTRVVLVLLILWLSTRFKRPALGLFWSVSFLVFFPLGDQSQHDYLDVDEVYAYLTVYLPALWLLQDRRDTRFLVISGLLWCFLSFIGVTKHTCFVLAVSVVMAVAGQHLLRRNWAAAGVGLILFPASLIVHWITADQRLANLPQFVRGIFAFSGGYNEAMSLNEQTSATIAALVVLSLVGARIAFNWWQEKREWGRATFEAFLLYVIWKHSFVRADPIHMMILFYAALVIIPPIFFVSLNRKDQASAADSPRPVRAEASWLKPAWCSIAMLAALVSTYVVIPDAHYSATRLWNHLSHNTAWLISPMARTRAMEEQLRLTKQTNALPDIKAVVGNHTVDYFGYEPGYVLLNDMNYSCRPMPITFAAANPLLQKANERFYRNPATAPEFVLFGGGGVDDRLFVQDDALAFRALLDNYRPVLMEQAIILFKRRESEEWKPSKNDRLIGERVLSMNQPLPCGELNQRLVWVEVTIKPTLLGKLRSFLYKAPSCYIGLHFEGESEMQFSRFITSMGECGFILNPFLRDNLEVGAFYDPRIGPNNFGQVSKLAFVCDERDKKFFKEEVQVRFYAFERPGH